MSWVELCCAVWGAAMLLCQLRVVTWHEAVISAILSLLLLLLGHSLQREGPTTRRTEAASR